MITNLDIAARLTMAALFGSLIGFERERLLWAAGVRTHILVSLGSFLLIIVSAYGFEHALEIQHVVLDPSHIAVQVVSGVAFLGAGSILMRGNFLRGLTTAASVWSVAAIGLATDGGLYFAAGLTTALILIILVGVSPWRMLTEPARKAPCYISICNRSVLEVEDLKRLLVVRGGQIKRMITTPVEEDLVQIKIHLARVSRRDIRACIARIKAEPGVQAVEINATKAEKIAD